MPRNYLSLRYSESIHQSNDHWDNLFTELFKWSSFGSSAASAGASSPDPISLIPSDADDDDDIEMEADPQQLALRPTGKSVDEQIRPLVFNQLRWQIKYYEKQIQFQKQQLERAVTQVEGRRQKWNDFLQRVESTKAAVTGELKEFKKIEAQITDIEEKIIFDLQLI